MTSEANPAPPVSPVPPVVVDARVWVSWLAPSDSNHRAVKLWMDQHRANGGEMVAPSLLLTEVAAGIRRATNNPSDAHAMAAFLGSFAPLLLVALEPTLVAASTYAAGQFALKAGDAFYVATAKELGVPLVTFDKAQLGRAAGYVTALEP